MPHTGHRPHARVCLTCVNIHCHCFEVYVPTCDCSTYHSYLPHPNMALQVRFVRTSPHVVAPISSLMTPPPTNHPSLREFRRACMQYQKTPLTSVDARQPRGASVLVDDVGADLRKVDVGQLHVCSAAAVMKYANETVPRGVSIYEVSSFTHLNLARFLLRDVELLLASDVCATQHLLPYRQHVAISTISTQALMDPVRFTHMVVHAAVDHVVPLDAMLSFATDTKASGWTRHMRAANNFDDGDDDGDDGGYSLEKPIRSAMLLVIFKTLARVARKASFDLQHERVPAALLAAAIDLDQTAYEDLSVIKQLLGDEEIRKLVEAGLNSYVVYDDDDDARDITLGVAIPLHELDFSNSLIMNHPVMQSTVYELAELLSARDTD